MDYQSPAFREAAHHVQCVVPTTFLYHHRNHRGADIFLKPDAMSRRHDCQKGSKAAENPKRRLLRPDQFIVPTKQHVYRLKNTTTPARGPRPPGVPTVSSRLDYHYTVPTALTVSIAPFSLHNNLVYYSRLLYVPDNHDLKLHL